VTKALVLGITDPSQDRIAAVQLAPFKTYQRLIKKRFNVTCTLVETLDLAAMHSAYLEHGDADIVVLRPHWQEQPDRVLDLVSSIRQNSRCKKLIFIDPFDQTSSRFFAVLPYVDWFLKYQCLRDLSEYQHEFAGGTRLTDYLVRQMGYDLGGWSVESRVDRTYEQRIVATWNLGIERRWQRQLACAQWRRILPQRRSIDVFCRLSLGSLHQQEWYGQYRLAAIEALRPLQAEYQLAIGGKFAETGLVSRRQYNRELRHSRIVFSPFGWGELSWRDFEAVCYGALLVKPSVEHIETEPNIFIPGETYVAVQWDFSDLAEQCRYYLQHPQEMARIAQNAQRLYRSYFERHQVVETIGYLLWGDRPPASQQRLRALNLALRY
jgi:Glycosyl transferases group 1